MPLHRRRRRESFLDGPGLYDLKNMGNINIMVFPVS